MKITETSEFRKSFDSLDKKIREKVKKQFVLFLGNIFHPSLNTEKLQPKSSGLWSFRIDKNFRVIFTFVDKDTILVLGVGSHDIYRKK